LTGCAISYFQTKTINETKTKKLTAYFYAWQVFKIVLYDAKCVYFKKVNTLCTVENDFENLLSVKMCS